MFMKVDKANYKEDISDRFDRETSEHARISSALGYLFFFVPMTMHPESKFALYHANQGMLLFIWMAFGVMIASMIPYIGPLLVIPMIAFGIACAVRGVIVALRCEAKHIPLLGKRIVIEYENKYSLEV